MTTWVGVQRALSSCTLCHPGGRAAAIRDPARRCLRLLGPNSQTRLPALRFGRDDSLPRTTSPLTNSPTPMATLALAIAGAAVGSAALPAGVSLLGATLSGAAIGSQIGALAGSFVDQALFAPSGQSRAVQGPRHSELRITT